MLRDGPASPFAGWFDVDWSVPDRAVLMAVLGDAHRRRARRRRADGRPPGDEPVLRYFEHEFPVRPGHRGPAAGGARRPAVVPARLVAGRRRGAELPPLLRRRHAGRGAGRGPGRSSPRRTRCCSSSSRTASLQGLRIDHPDGLADPRGYLRRLAEATGGAWVVVEKILEGDEQLPADWPCAGTTGYDASGGSAACSPTRPARPRSADLLTELTGESTEFAAVVEEAKREVVEHSLYAEVNRLTDLLAAICHDDIALRDHTRRQLGLCVVELLVAFDRLPRVRRAGRAGAAESVEVRRARPSRRPAAGCPEDALGRRSSSSATSCSGARRPRAAAEADAARRAEFVVRFQQTCGPVMAKGVEDTAFYRWHRLVALNEVGGDPEHLGVPPEEFHAFAAHAAGARGRRR